MELIAPGAARLDDLSEFLTRQRPHVIHFSGHGVSGDPLPVAADNESGSVTPKALTELLRTLKDSTRVVVFNACGSETQAKTMVEEIPWAVGVSRGIGDDDALAFAGEFYQALASGRSVRDAYDLGVARLASEGVADAKGLVTLHKRQGIDPSEAVLDEAEAADPPATTVTEGPFPTIGTKEWGLMNRRRDHLIRKKNRLGLTAEEQVEFERLQRLCFAAIEGKFPRPVIDEDGLRRLRESL